MTRIVTALACRLAGHQDTLDFSPIGVRVKCMRCARVTTGFRHEGDGMTPTITDDPRLGFELSQIAATIAEQIHRADVLRGAAPARPFRSLELPMRRHYLSLGEKAILLRQGRDQVINIDQHREVARASLRAIQRNRAYCVVTPLMRTTHGGGK